MVEQLDQDKAKAVQDLLEREEIDPELLKDLKQRHPEMFAGTPEWNTRVRAAAAKKMYDESGLVIIE